MNPHTSLHNTDYTNTDGFDATDRKASDSLSRASAAECKFNDSLGLQGSGPSLDVADAERSVLSYYSGNDSRVANDPNSEQGRGFFASLFREWTHLIKAITTDVLTGTRSSGKNGLLGFSQGGFLATTVAGKDPQISAQGLFYGGIPAAARHEIVQLPPLLELHGDADRVVPLAQGQALVTLAKGLG
ncbi:dienelactone hydrolase family protein [Niveibacterium terrae]|uniref:dienelactone hydrolase family protein n=1 Tax=Niveibacterium terrae TaxID=3373598 RepID=UPI003A8D541D